MRIYLDHCAYNRPFDDQKNIKIQLETYAKCNNFDYTEWHKNLWNDKTVEEIHNMATEFERNKLNN